MEKLYFLFFMRPIQFLGVALVFSGVRNMGPLMVEAGRAWAGNSDVAAMCGRIVAVTGPCAMGGLWVWLLEYFIGEERRLRLGLKAFADEPWMINPMWAGKRVLVSNRKVMVAFWVAVGLYLTVALPYAIATRRQSPLNVVGIGGLVMVMLARMCWLKRKWNAAELRLGTLPGVVGGPFTGVVVLQEEFPPGTPFEISLRCMELQKRTSNAVVYVDRTDGKTHWSSVLHIDKTLKALSPGTTAIPVSFAVPLDCPATTIKTPMGESTIRWKLSVSLKNSPGEGGCVFEVPVFKTAESCRTFRLDEELIAPFYETVDPEAVAFRTRTRRTVLADGTQRWDFSTLSLGAVVFFVGLTAVSGLSLAAAIGLLRPWPITVFVGFFSAVFVGIGLFGLVETLLWRSSIECGREELTIRSGIWGLQRTAAAPRDKRTRLECEIDIRKGNGEWWCIWIQPPARVLEQGGGEATTRFVTAEEDADEPDELETIETPRLKLVKRLDGRVEAEAFQAWLAEELGISGGKSS